MEDFFLRIAHETECKSVKGAANVNIRRFAIKKDEIPRRVSSSRQESHDGSATNDENLLPTPGSLKTAFASTEVVAELLQCRCASLCGPLWSNCNPRQDSELAKNIHQQITSDRNRRNALAVLILSGCTFALREFFHSDCSTVEEFLSEVNIGGDSGVSDAGSRDGEDRDDSGIRIRLFRRLPSCSTWTGETVSSIAAKFVESIRAKSWLVRIRQFGPSGQLVSFSTARRHNMPFVEEKTAFQGRLNRRYLKFKIADGYALSEQLQGRTLFRKELTFHPSLVGNSLAQEAHDEVKLLGIVNEMGHENIAKMLFAFEEQDPLHQRISIVFRYNEFDLSTILHRPAQQSAHILSRFDNAMQPPVPFEGLLEHGLWKAMLGIVDAVKSLHEFQHPTIQADTDEVIHAEHFDIKPANILIEIRNQRPAKLLLTDFGRARLDAHPVDQTSGYPDIPGTYDYAPPEADIVDDDRGAETPASDGSVRPSEIKMRRTYDVFSLGCVLLEVLVHVTSGDGEGFLHARERESKDSLQNAAFWCRDRRQTPRLRSATETNLRDLEKSRHPNVERVARCIRNMLSLKETDRREWPVTRCLAAFQTIEMPSWNEMMPSSKRALLEPELQNMTTMCWRRNFQQPLHCNLFYFRDRIPSESDEATLIVERPGVPWNESRLIREEKTAPLPFFDARALSGSTQSTSATMSVAFERLHSGMLFHFQRMSEYLKFFTLLTYQHIVLGNAKIGLDIRCRTCDMHISRRPLPSKVESVGACRVQLWSTYDEREYDRKFETQSSGLQAAMTSQTRDSASLRGSIAAPGGRSLPAAQNSRFKLALFTLNSQPGTGMRCIVFELDRENIQLDSRASNGSRVSFSRAGDHSSFPVAIFEPSIGVASSNGVEQQYPGIPMSRDHLNESIRESRTRVKKLELELSAQRQRDGTNLLALLDQYQVF